MKLAVFGDGKKKEVEKLVDLMDAVEDWDFDGAEESDREAMKAVLRQLDGMRHILSHLQLAYETIFSYCCDPKAEILEFKPELAAFMDVIGNNANGVQLIAEERAKQLKKWGSVEHDKQYCNHELVWNALALLSASMPGLNPIDTWGLIAKHPDRIEQLKIAGALIAAEIDRLQFKTCGVEESEAPHAAN